MAEEHSFDIVCKVDLQEVSNAVNQAMKELSQRFDFKGSKSRLDFSRDKAEVVVLAEDEQKMRSVRDILETKLVKRKVPLKGISYGKPEKASGDMVRQVAGLQQGISTERAKDLVKFIKDMKLKVQAEIQEDQVRVRGKKIDDLQAIIAALKEKPLDYHIQFINYR